MTIYKCFFGGIWLGIMLAGNAFASTHLGAGSTLQVMATIMDGVCEVEFNTTTLIFTPTIPSQFFEGGTTEILPIKMKVKCNYARTPMVSVTGEQPYAGNTRVFLDSIAGKPNGNGVGFMIRPAMTEKERETTPALNSFYSQGMAGSALQAGIATHLIPITQIQNYVDQVLWVGLVGVWPTNKILAGEFKSTLTITVAIP